MIGIRAAPAVLALSLACALPARAAEDAFEGMAGPNGERLRYDEKGLTVTFPEPDVTLNIGGRLHMMAARRPSAGPAWATRSPTPSRCAAPGSSRR